MKFPAPSSQVLSRVDLLEHVREELRTRYPAFATVVDTPGDPGWMLVEQAAWIAEALSGVLDNQPRAVIEFLLALLGRDLRPATPSIGLVALQSSETGILRPMEGISEGAPPLRLLAPTTETREEVEFCPAEAEVPLATGRLRGIYKVEGGRLLGRHLTQTDFPASNVALADGLSDMSLLDRERVVYRIDRKLDKVLTEVLDKLVTAFESGNPAAVGWLRLSYKERGSGVDVTADINPVLAFAAEGTVRSPSEWGRIHDWRPELQPAIDSGARVEVDGDGTPVLRGCPDEGPPEELVRPVQVAPSSFPDQFWRHLRRLAGDSGNQLPQKALWQRSAVAPADTPSWLAQLPFQPVWKALEERGGTLLSLQIDGDFRGDDVARFALLFDSPSPQRVPPEIVALAADGSTPSLRPEWSVALPRPAGAGLGMCTVAAFRVGPEALRPGGDVILRVHGGAARIEVLGVVLNPALVINAPIAVDGRSADVGLGPGEIDLLWDDLLSRPVLEALWSRLPEEGGRPLRRVLRALPLARIRVERNGEVVETLDDWDALHMDAAEGRAQFGVPGEDGRRRFLPGSTLHFDWYRRTSGDFGNLDTGEISELDHSVEQGPEVLAVINPLPTHLGEPAESAPAAVYRLFGPERGAIPTVPSDLERTAREALGPSQGHWLVRIWTHAERLLLGTGLWGAEHGEPWVKELLGLALRRLDRLGSSGLLVAIGDPERPVERSEFVAVAAAVQRRLRSVADRVPYIRDVVVIPLHPLRVISEEDVDADAFPVFHLDRLPPGRFVGLGVAHSHELPAGTDVLLDAVIVEAQVSHKARSLRPTLPDAPGFEEMQIRDW